MTVAGPGPFYSPEHRPAQTGWNLLCVLSLVLTLTGFAIGWPVCLAGLVLAVIGLAQVRRSRERGAGLAMTSVVLNVLPLLLLLVVGMASVAWGVWGMLN